MTKKYYRRAKSYLDRKEYDRAVDEFNRVIENKGHALGWGALLGAPMRRTSRDAAMTRSPAWRNCKKVIRASRWLDDAKALQVEVQQQRGTPVSPESATDEDLKLLALNSLMNTDPDRSVPMLEKLLKSSNSPKLKRTRSIRAGAKSFAKIAGSAGRSCKGRFQPRSASESDRIPGRLRRPRQLADAWWMCTREPMMSR